MVAALLQLINEPALQNKHLEKQHKGLLRTKPFTRPTHIK